MQQVKIVNVENGVFCNELGCSTQTYTLQNSETGVKVRCEDVAIMETEGDWLEETFYEWCDAAEAGEKGYSFVV